MSSGVTTNAVPNPGSDEAVASGCTCPVIDNHHGKGWSGWRGVFVYTSGCPAHWPAGTKLGPFVAARQEKQE